MELVNINSFCNARYARETHVVYYHYAGLIHAALGLETLRAVMLFAESNPVKGIVSDIRSMKGTFTSVNEFFEKEYYPHMVKHGLRCSAIILSNDIFTKFAAQDLTKKVGQFQLQMFDNFPEGEDWVLSKM